MDLYEKRVLKLRKHIKEQEKQFKQDGKVKEEEVEQKDYTKVELQELLKEKGIAFKKGSTKADLKALLDKEV